MRRHFLIMDFLFNTLLLTSPGFAISYSNALLRATRHFVTGVVWVLMLVGGATSTLATPFTLNINGMVSSVDPLLASFFSVGDSMTSSFTYEPSIVTPLVCQPGFCAFDAVTAYSFTVGGISGVGSSGQVHLDTFGPSHEIDFLGLGTVTPSLPGWLSDRPFVVSLTDSTGTSLIDQYTLPTSVDVANFDSNRWFLGFSRISDGQFAFVTGVLPEPDMLWPILIVTVGIVLWKERRRRREEL